MRKWSTKEKWKLERSKREEKKNQRSQKREIEREKRFEEKVQQLEDAVYDEFAEKAEESIKYLLDYSRIAARVVAEEQILIYQKKPAKHDLKRLAELGKIAKNTSDVVKGILPQFSEELAERLIKDMQEKYENERRNIQDED